MTSFILSESSIRFIKIKLKKVLNNNYSSRLNLNNDYDNLSDVFEELLGLVSSKKL